MNRNFDSQHKSQAGSGASLNKFSNQSSTPRKEVDSDEKRSEGGSSGVLREIPWAGPYLDFIYRKWGWSGIFLILGGFAVAAVLVFTGLYPTWAVHDGYKDCQNNASKSYELKRKGEINWDTVIKSAKHRLTATGVALSSLDSQRILERAEAGVVTTLTYVDPCGDAIVKRQTDENNYHAARNIVNTIQKFDPATNPIDEKQKRFLEVKITPAYPTMVVIIADEDLYAYFCAYGSVCSDSPVLVFHDYEKNEAASFFKAHVDKIPSEQVTDYKFPKGPCPALAARARLPQAPSPQPVPSQ
jgi:hypothetical protein